MKKNYDLLPLLGLATLLFLSACRKDDPALDATLGPLRSAPSHNYNDSTYSPPVVLITDSQQLPPPVLPKAPLPQPPPPQQQPQDSTQTPPQNPGQTQPPDSSQPSQPSQPAQPSQPPVQPPPVQQPPAQDPPPQVPPQQNTCPVYPIYGDTIIYPQPTNGTDYIANPVNIPGPGKYLSWPVGMVMDSSTGAIDVTASETGMKYIIGYVKNGTHDTCLSYLTIGGASYADSVYVLSLNETEAFPYFEANPNLLNLCQNTNKCSFDVTGSAAKMHVVVDKYTGVIDLKKTLNGTSLLGLGGAFGLLPVNGQTITTDIYYQIGDDPSNNALQHIAVQLVYYDQTQLINIGLLNNILTKLDNLTSGNTISTTTNPRPPLVVIVRHN